MVGVWGRKWWKDWVENGRNLIQRMAEFRGGKRQISGIEKWT